MSDIEPKKLKVAELREELRERGLDTKGNKAQLVKRLEKALKAEAAASDDAAGWYIHCFDVDTVMCVTTTVFGWRMTVYKLVPTGSNPVDQRAWFTAWSAAGAATTGPFH